VHSPGIAHPTDGPKTAEVQNAHNDNIYQEEQAPCGQAAGRKCNPSGVIRIDAEAGHCD
jgi:hypothetical protein